MKIAILDTVNQDIGLKIIFPEADYFIHNDEDCTNIERQHSYSIYNFVLDKDLSKIVDSNYDTLFIIMASYNIDKNTPYFQENILNIYNKITQILDQNNFKVVALFDNYDFDYDPNIYITHPKINLFFKRNYNKNRKYKENVVPFPFIIFGKKSVIERCDTELVSEKDYFKEKINRCFFTGNLFSKNDIHYNDPIYSVIERDRRQMYSKIGHEIYNPGHLSNHHFVECLRNSKFSLDLLGVGEPNIRSFEIILSGSLKISQYNPLLWPFEDGDAFSEETIFKNEIEFFEKINRLKQDRQLYLQCLQNQYRIVKKYFNKEWLKNYVCDKINCFMNTENR